MKKTREKDDDFKILVIVLTIAIVIVIVGGSLLFFISGSKEVYSENNNIKTSKLKIVTPKENDMKLAVKITVSTNGAQKEEGAKEVNTDDKTTGGYIIEDSATRLLTNSDITGLSAKELNYAKNEIYARHGRKFDSQELKDYFESKSWYEGKYDGADFDANYSADVLSDIEKKNAEFLKTAENEAQSGGYKLDQ